MLAFVCIIEVNHPQAAQEGPDAEGQSEKQGHVQAVRLLEQVGREEGVQRCG